MTHSLSAAADPIDDLLDAAHRLAALGLSPGTSGNVSVRIGERIFLSATGSSMSSISSDDLSELRLDGEHVAGPPPTKEAPLHLAFYAKADDLRAVVHLHSPNAVAASCLPPHSERSALPPITPYFVMRVGQTPLIPYAAPGSNDHADELRSRGFRFRSALLQNHGSIVAAATVEGAAESAIELEAAAEVLLRLQSGPFNVLSESQARELADRFGSCWDDPEGSAR